MRALLAGCGLTVGVIFLLSLACGFWFANVLEDPEGMSVTLVNPLETGVGEEFDLEVQVTNQHESKPLQVSQIDIYDGYLDGFAIVSVDPAPTRSERFDLGGLKSMDHYFDDVSIPVGEQRSFTFRLKAIKPGIYRGDVDVYQGDQFLTQVAQTVVREEGAAPQ